VHETALERQGINQQMGLQRALCFIPMQELASKHEFATPANQFSRITAVCLNNDCLSERLWMMYRHSQSWCLLVECGTHVHNLPYLPKLQHAPGQNSNCERLRKVEFHKISSIKIPVVWQA
jgi:hypothetical protein